MKNIFDNKKLLILGGPALACNIIETARSMGIITIVTDWYTPEQMPAKKIADMYFMTSNADVDAVVKLIKKEGIDGVLTGFTDSTLPYYQQICEKAGLPCYATAEQFEITSNKGKFKQLCKKFGVPVVEEYNIDNGLNNKSLSSITYPVIVKPVDNSGAKGIKICYDEKQLKEAYKDALSFSESKRVLIERYMTNKEVTIFYVLDNGEIYHTAMGDRHTKKNQDGVIPLPVAYTFPSKHLEKYRHNLDQKVIEMFKSIGMKNGMVFIQSFIEDGECVFYEMGYRLTGSLEHELLEKISGFNPMKMILNFSLTGEMDPENLLNRVDPKFVDRACNITFLVRPGEIGKIEGINKIRSFPGVVYALPSYKEGDIVKESAKGTLQQVVLRVFAITKTKKELAKVMDKIHDTFSVTDKNNNNMLLETFNTNELINE